MGGEPRAVAARLRRPGWRDPRLIVGVMLIAAAVAGVALTLREADRTAPVFTARAVLVPGTVLEESHVTVAHVRVGDGYLAAPDAEPWGLVVARTIDEGELIPASALVERDAFDGRPVAVTATMPVAETVVPGAVVDVWVTDAGAGSRRVGESLVVSAVDREDGAFGTGGETVYVVVAAAEVGALLESLATGDEVAVVGIG